MSEKKRIAAVKAVEWVRDGMTVGLGTGSTAYYAIERIGSLVKEGYELLGVATSIETERLAKEFRIPTASIDEVDGIDLTIDGADEVDPEMRLIKGMGGALLREKIIASASHCEIIAVDDSKLVRVLGTRTPLPVEVIPFGHKRTKASLERLGCAAVLRGGDEPYRTDNGNYTYDCRFGGIENPEEMEQEINMIPGVVENGLFIGLVTRVVVGTEKGPTVIERGQV